MKKKTIALTVVVLASPIMVVLGAQRADAMESTSPAMTTVIGTPGDVAIGDFYHRLLGTSLISQAGTNAQVYGRYAGLGRNRAYFTVAYGNTNCDPAQAFPIGPFYTDARGRATFAASVPLAVDLGGTGSVSVRRGDNATDIDGDGLTGPTDVVAVPGQPGIGLIECDSNPAVGNFS